MRSPMRRSHMTEFNLTATFGERDGRIISHFYSLTFVYFIERHTLSWRYEVHERKKFSMKISPNFPSKIPKNLSLLVCIFWIFRVKNKRQCQETMPNSYYVNYKRLWRCVRNAQGETLPHRRLRREKVLKPSWQISTKTFPV